MDNSPIVYMMHTHINETGIDVVRAFLSSLVLQDNSPVLVCRSHDRSHDIHNIIVSQLTRKNIDISVLSLVHIFISSCKAIGI